MAPMIESNIRDDVLEAVEESRLAAEDVLLACLKFMSQDDVRDMLRANEMLHLVGTAQDHELI